MRSPSTIHSSPSGLRSSSAAAILLTYATTLALSWLFEPQHDDAGILIGRVCTNVGKVQIQSQQDAAFAAYSRSNPLVVRTHQALVPNGFGVEATLSTRSCG